MTSLLSPLLLGTSLLSPTLLRAGGTLITRPLVLRWLALLLLPRRALLLASLL